MTAPGAGAASRGETTGPLTVFYPWREPVTRRVRGHVPDGFPKRLVELDLREPTVQVAGLTVDLDESVPDQTTMLLSGLDALIDRVEGSKRELEEKRELIALYPQLPHADDSQRLYTALANHFGKLGESRAAVLEFYRVLNAEFDRASTLDRESREAGFPSDARHRDRLHDQLGERRLPEAARAELARATTLHGESLATDELEVYIGLGPPYDDNVAAIKGTIPELTELAAYYTAMSRGERPAKAILGANLRDLRVTYADNTELLAEYHQQLEYLGQTSRSLREIRGRVEGGELTAALDDLQRDQLAQLDWCASNELWPSDEQWAELLRAEANNLTPATVRVNPAIVTHLLGGSASLIEDANDRGLLRPGIAAGQVRDLLGPITHATAVALRASGREDYQQAYRRALTSDIGRGLVAAADGAFNAIDDVKALGSPIRPSEIVTSRPAMPERRMGIRGRSGNIGGAPLWPDGPAPGRHTLGK